MQDKLFYLTQFLDRKGLERGKADWFAKVSSDPQTYYIPVWERKNLFDRKTGEAVLLRKEEVNNPEEAVYLGSTEGEHFLAIRIEERSSISSRGVWATLRSKSETISHKQNALLAFSTYLFNWHASAAYCGRCGHKTVPVKGGFARVCLNPDKAHEHFPRTDAAMIVLVEHEGKCLLGRKANWEKGRYSILAGFVEAMESVEETIKREVYEETNIQVERVRYVSSQPWPFPASLMLGYRAMANNTDIILHDGELENARWFSREAFADELRSGQLKLPSFTSISFHLIQQWYEEGGKALADVLNR